MLQEVEQLIPPSYRKKKNGYGLTPQDLFAKEHAYLISKGEDWMNNYMLVATLIATIVFAAAFILPGGYNQNTGIPFFSKEPSLIIFVISDAVSLITSSTSVLIFLCILTSRYAEHDSMQLLPSRLMFCVATLYLSIVTMMIAFSASFFFTLQRKAGMGTHHYHMFGGHAAYSIRQNAISPSSGYFLTTRID
ncbi:putative PGG domain-containing protein [Helianthus annuus]|nr:putative PGG domain-containing protein [Helianthus annuus]